MAIRKTTPKKAPKASAPKARTTRAKRATATKAKAPQAPAKKPRTTEAPAAKKLSQFQAAIRVLAETGEPMTCRAMVEAMTKPPTEGLLR